MCPRCHVKLIPIVYGKLTPELVDLDRDGKIIIGNGNYKVGKPISFCVSCEEAFDILVYND